MDDLDLFWMSQGKLKTLIEFAKMFLKDIWMNFLLDMCDVLGFKQGRGVNHVTWWQNNR